MGHILTTVLYSDNIGFCSTSCTEIRRRRRYFLGLCKWRRLHIFLICYHKLLIIHQTLLPQKINAIYYKAVLCCNTKHVSMAVL